MRRILIFLLLVPASLGAQTRTSVSGYIATDPGVAGDPLLVGVTVARERGPLAARLGMGFDVSPPPATAGGSELGPTTTAPGPTTGGIWSTDADALLYLGDPSGSATLVPYGVVGVGTRGIQTGGKVGAALNYSYGGGFRAPIGAGFAMEGEARFRENFVEFSGGGVPVVASGMEYRFGISAGFGGRPRSVGPRMMPASLPARGSVVDRGSLTGSSGRLVAATLGTAERYIGVPYQWGGNTPESGFDCSGFIRYVFNQHGVTVPRVSRDQARFGSEVPLDLRYFQPGDIIAFASDGRVVDHTAIYAGNGRIIHSSSSGRGVRYDDLYSQRGSWYLEHMVAVRRVVDGGRLLGG